jgi:O-acetylhomoserine (thiol)-lyase
VSYGSIENVTLGCADSDSRCFVLCSPTLYSSNSYSLPPRHNNKEHPKVEWVRYPGLEDDPEYEKNIKYLKGKGGSLVVFEIKGGADRGKTFIDSLTLLSHVANVGDAKSLAIHPATTTHSQLNQDQQKLAGITPGMVRLSIGIESIDDIIADIEQALDET